MVQEGSLASLHGRPYLAIIAGNDVISLRTFVFLDFFYVNVFALPIYAQAREIAILISVIFTYF